MHKTQAIAYLNKQKVIQDSLIKSGYWEAQVKIGEQNNIQIQKGRPYYWQSIKVYEDKLLYNISLINKLEGGDSQSILFK